MATKNKQKPRVVIYGTGHFGQRITQYAVEKGWPIVAAFNRAGAKVGQDLGRLAGLDKDLGVIVQDCDQVEFSKVDADIGIVGISDRLSINLPAYRNLMNGGMNVICHGSESYYPQGIDTGLANEIDELGKKNNVTFTGAKIWDHTRTWPGIVVAAACDEIYSFLHKSITDAE